MAGRITAITPQKRNRRRASVFIDDHYAFSLFMTTAAALPIGKKLSDEEREALLLADQQEQAFDRALHYLKFRPRSRMEMIRYLKGKGFSDTAVDATIRRLESYQYIDDTAFARFWIESRQRHRPRGAFGLRFELREKGVADTVIEDLLADYDENAAAWRAVAPKLNRWANLSERAMKEKIYRFLRQRGFASTTCADVFQEADRQRGEF
ncbi:MAG: RecX family transcriptional regulator [Thermodesulfobacteriota bacterium]